LRILIPIAVLAVLVALVVNTAAKLYRWVQALGLKLHPAVFGVVFGLLLLGLVAGSFVVQFADVGWSRPWAWAGDLAMGAMAYAMMACAVVEVLRWLGRAVGLLESPCQRPVTLVTGAVVLALVAGLVTYGAVHRTQIVTTEYDVTLASSRADQRPLRAALISDLHLGELNRAAQLARIVDAVEALDPDVVFIAGDVFDGTFWGMGDPAPIAAQFKRLDAPLGVIAVMGNHDAGSSYPDMVGFLESVGVTVLQDQVLDLDGRVTLVGRRDSSPIRAVPEPRADMDLSNLTSPVIVLDHQPSNLRDYVGQADLVLSGHTHQGQIWPGNLIVGALYEDAYGLYQVPGDQLQAVTTSGAATWGPPLRIATNDEVVLLNLAFVPA
jgi:predicted MPP superfamily phosphohydrolase